MSEIRDTFREAGEQLKSLIGDSAKVVSRFVLAHTNKSQRKVTAVTAVALMVAAGFAILTATVGIYLLGWQNDFAYRMSRILPIPAAYVNRTPVSVYDYLLNLRSQAKYFEIHKVNQKLTAKQQNEQAMAESANQALISAWARSHHIELTDQESTKALDGLYKDGGGKKKALSDIKKQYGLDSFEFSYRAKQQLLDQKVTLALQQDPTLVKQSQDQAASLLQKLKQGADFTNLQQLYSQDVSATKTGDAMLVSAGNLPISVADAVTAVADGQLVTGAVTAKGNTYILKREKTVDGVVLARIILLKPPTLARWLAAQSQTAHILKLLPQLR